MTAAWRRGSLPTARRSNKRIVILVVAVAVLGVIVGEVAADVVGSGHAAGRVAAQTYVAEVIPVVDGSTSLAATLHLVRNGSALLDRTQLERALGDLVTGTADDNAQLQSLGVPAPTARSGQLLESALEARGAVHATSPAPSPWRSGRLSGHRPAPGRVPSWSRRVASSSPPTWTT